VVGAKSGIHRGQGEEASGQQSRSAEEHDRKRKFGGDKRAFERVKPTLLEIGAKATYIGANGMAVQMKLAVNLVLMVEVIAFGEGIALAEKGGVPREVVSTGESVISFRPALAWSHDSQWIAYAGADGNAE